MTPRSSIRRSTNDDLKAILRWLRNEEHQGIKGNFWCNRARIREAHNNKELVAYIDGRSKKPVAFLLGGLIKPPGIMEVRNNYRGQGIGSRLVKHCINSARKKDQPLLFIECLPDSVQFWEKMGFIFSEEQDDIQEHKIIAYQIIEKKFHHPQKAGTVLVKIGFFPERRKYWDGENVPPYAEFCNTASVMGEGEINLCERISFHEQFFSRNTAGGNDTIVKIEINDSVIYMDKAKYQQAHNLGIRRCFNGYYFDKVIIPPGFNLV